MAFHPEVSFTFLASTSIPNTYRSGFIGSSVALGQARLVNQLIDQSPTMEPERKRSSMEPKKLTVRTPYSIALLLFVLAAASPFAFAQRPAGVHIWQQLRYAWDAGSKCGMKA